MLVRCTHLEELTKNGFKKETYNGCGVEVRGFDREQAGAVVRLSTIHDECNNWDSPHVYVNKAGQSRMSTIVS